MLIFAVGNESRGDDALGPLLLRRIAASLGDESGDESIELIEDFQLQVEHITDLVGREHVLFVDADVSCESPLQLSAIRPENDTSYSSHAMTPFAVLHAYRQVYGTDAPPSSLLRIRGHGFELGEGLSAEAAANLEQAVARVREWLTDISPDRKKGASINSKS
ncbi:MAG: hydrogenase maturation protease [Gallionella sp.]|nr:hydrogenase maturation protease [Gallionella sp.]